jgi:hypothetical protein
MASAPAIDVAALLAQMAALTEQVAKLSAAKAAAPAEAKPKKAGKKSAPSPSPADGAAAAPTAEKPKRALNEKIAGEGGWNAFVAETLEAAQREGWPEFKSLKGEVFQASVVGAEGTHTFPDGKKMTRINGGLVYCSFLKNQADPGHEAKSKATRERRDAQMAAKAAEKASASGSDAESESGASAAAKPASKRSEAAKARFADPAAKEALRARLAAGKAAKKAAAAGGAAAASAPAAAAEKPAEKPATVDLNFESWEFEGASYAKNARGDVISEEGDWVGRFDGSKIDKSVAKPTDIDEYIGLE